MGKRVLLAAINSQYVHSCPALYALRRAAACPCEWGEWTINMPREQVLRQICAHQPQLLGISVYIWNGDYVAALCADLRRVLPDCRIVLGGPEAAARAAWFIERRLCDLVALGEGEQLWRDLTAGVPEEQLTGVMRADGSGAAAPPLDLDRLPLPYTASDLAALQDKIVYYESSRGCPYRCTFCASGTEPPRFRSWERVRDDLVFLAQQRTGQIKFVDRTFNADPQRAAAICELLLQLYKPGLSWHFEIAPDLVSERLLELWASAPSGYFQLEMGVQSLNPASLRAVRRADSWAKTERAARQILARDNCHLHLDLIAGLPHETYDSFEQAFNALHRLYPHQLQLGFLKVLPGSALAQEADALGLVYSDHAPYQVLRTQTLSAAQLFWLQEIAVAVDGFYNCGRFRQTLYHAANSWPGGALAFYGELARRMRRCDGGLSVGARAEMLCELLLSGPQRALYFDLLRLDWRCYSHGQALLPHLKGADDKRGCPVVSFDHCFSFGENGLCTVSEGAERRRFFPEHKLGVSGRTAAKVLLASDGDL